MIRAILAVLRCFGRAACPGFISGAASFVDSSVLVPFAGPFAGAPFAGFSESVSSTFLSCVDPGIASAVVVLSSAEDRASVLVGLSAGEVIPKDFFFALYKVDRCDD